MATALTGAENTQQTKRNETNGISGRTIGMMGLTGINRTFEKQSESNQSFEFARLVYLKGDGMEFCETKDPLRCDDAWFYAKRIPIDPKYCRTVCQVRTKGISRNGREFR